MKKPKTERLALDLVSLVDPGDAQTVEVMLMPWGEVKTSDGRDFKVDEESVESITKVFAAGKKDIPIDFEHTTEGGRYGTASGAAPASGWITKIYAKVGIGVFAEVKWNSAARTMIRGDEYRYLSPVVMVRKSDQKALAVTSAALTNVPAIVDMERVAAKETDIGDEVMNFTELKAALIAAGVTLKDDAEGDDVLGAAKAFVESAAKTKSEPPPLSAVAAKLGLDGSATTEVIVAKIDAMQVETVPAVEYKALAAKVATLESASRDREGQEAVAYGIETAKINPNNAPLLDLYRIEAKADPAAFKKKLDLMTALYSVDRVTKPSAKLDGGDERKTVIMAAKEEYKSNPKHSSGTRLDFWVDQTLREKEMALLSADEKKAL